MKKVSIGVRQQDRDAFNYGPREGDILRIDYKKGDVLLRMVDGPRKFRNLLIPVMGTDGKGAWLNITVSPQAVLSHTVIGQIAVAEKALKVASGVDPRSARSQLDGTLKAGYLGFDRKASGPAVLRAISVPPSVAKELAAKEKMRDVRNPDMLMYGPQVLYDVAIKPTQDGEFWKYRVEPYQNRFAGKVPVSYLDTGIIPPEYIDAAFLPEEHEAINMHPKGLDEYFPYDDAVIEEKLQGFLVNLSARDKMGRYMFQQAARLSTDLKKLGIPFWFESSPATQISMGPANLQMQHQPEAQSVASRTITQLSTPTVNTPPPPGKGFSFDDDPEDVWRS